MKLWLYLVRYLLSTLVIVFISGHLCYAIESMQEGAKVFSANDWCLEFSTKVESLQTIIKANMRRNLDLPKKDMFETTEEYNSRISPIIKSAKKVRTKSQKQLDEILSSLYDIRFPVSNKEIKAVYIADKEVWDYISIPLGKTGGCLYFDLMKAYGESYDFEGETYSLPMKVYNPHGVRTRPQFQLQLSMRIVLRYFPMPRNVAKRFLEFTKSKDLTISLVGGEIGNMKDPLDSISRYDWYFKPSKIVILKDGIPRFSANFTEAFKVTFY